MTGAFFFKGLYSERWKKTGTDCSLPIGEGCTRGLWNGRGGKPFPLKSDKLSCVLSKNGFLLAPIGFGVICGTLIGGEWGFTSAIGDGEFGGGRSTGLLLLKLKYKNSS
jgi:hypothetical protein